MSLWGKVMHCKTLFFHSSSGCFRCGVLYTLFSTRIGIIMALSHGHCYVARGVRMYTLGLGRSPTNPQRAWKTSSGVALARLLASFLIGMLHSPNGTFLFSLSEEAQPQEGAAGEKVSPYATLCHRVGERGLSVRWNGGV